MSKAAFKATILGVMQSSAGKSKEAAQEDYAEALANAVADLIESGTTNTEVTTPDTINGTGSGSATIPA